MKRKVLLIEPDYKNKYPPMPLMKLATYYRQLGDDVRFFKGNLKEFAAEILCEKLYKKLKDKNLARYYSNLKHFIYHGKYDVLYEIPDFVQNDYYMQTIKEFRQKFIDEKFNFFDVVAITTLFTFYWTKTIDTINYSKKFIKRNGNLYVGGIVASILPQYIESETGIKPIEGLLDKPEKLDKDNAVIIDELPLDYSILEEIDYIYPSHDAYFAYMTRGCIRNCPFCAVKILEPNYKNYISIKKQIAYINEHFGAKTDLLLMDNNVFASNRFYDIIDEIKECGYAKDATYIPPSEYDITLENIKNKHNERAYFKKMIQLYDKISAKLSEEDAGAFYSERESLGLLYVPTVTKKSILKFDKKVKPLYDKYFKHIGKKRSIDFNQGIDARLVTDDKMKKLSEVAINPLRIAFDHYDQKDIYEKAVRIAAKNGIVHLSNYLLYNYEDTPDELYYRMKLNVDLCEELNVTIYSFPMKYHPIDNPEYFSNRNYIGTHWNRKFIRAVQAVLNSTKGKIGRGKSFFEKAFGSNIEEFHKILWMPETFIIKRLEYENNLTKEWYEKFEALNEEERKIAEKVIAKNCFDNETIEAIEKENVVSVLKYYQIKK